MAEPNTLRGRFTQVEGPLWLLVPIYLAAVAYFYLMGNQLHLGMAVVNMIILALSIDFILGFAGINSLGQAALSGAGAYMAGFLPVYFGWAEPITGLLVAGLVGAVMAYVTGIIALRGGELTVLAMTIIVAAILYEFANSYQDITGGFDGLRGIDIDRVFGLFKFDLWGRTGFVYSVCVLFVVHIALRVIVNSPFGVMMRGLRENPVRMRALGTPVFHRLLIIYAIGGFVAGIAGGLQTQTHEFVSMEVFAFHVSATALTVVIIGGLGRLYGAFIGAVIYVVFQDVFAKMAPQYWYFWLGLLLVLVALFAHGGVVSLIDKAAARIGLAGRRAR
ncbi:branched-chain amino acid ABC transporter permease [Amorphus coralli]|uniref:branched-chain amino acid ABC transporter permease n=1 Tax=Amorphus coralli TaxID=340680 RepID=UPI000371B1E4|nr:branched-chain amino acid ABC transporter permease [Amorphus coralli]